MIRIVAVLVCGLAAAACHKSGRKAGPPGDAGGLIVGGAGARPRDGGLVVDGGGPRRDAAVVTVDAALLPPIMPADGGAGGSDGGVAEAYDGRTGWLVLAEDFDKHARAMARVAELRALGVEATPVHSHLLANLRPGWVVVVLGRFDDQASALAAADALRAQVPKVRVKQSGPIVGGGGVDAGTFQQLARLVKIEGIATHEEDASPKLFIETPDGEFDSRPDVKGNYEFWVASTGSVAVTMLGKERHFPERCSRKGANDFWAGRDQAATEIDASVAAVIVMDDLERRVEADPCD
jgi:SPOR domain